MIRRALATLCLAPAALGAQEPVWIDQLYPFAYYSTIDGFWLGGHYGWSSPMTAERRPEPHFANLRFDAAASTQGSYAVVLDAQAPGYWDGWRLGMTFHLTRSNRLGYYGQGNDTEFHADSLTPASPFLYRVSRTTRGARVTVQRRVFGPVRLLAGGTLERTDFRELPGDSWFRRDRLAGTIDADDVPFNDGVIRGGLVVDWRDQEVDPHRGVFAEVLVGNGSGYTRTTAAVRAYAHPFGRLMLAGRLAAERMTGDPPVAAQLTVESSQGPATALGGYFSLRGYHDGRFVGPGKLLGGVEARYAIVWAPRVLEIKLVAFYDFGRVFGPGERVRLTRSGLHSSGGAEVALALLRNTLIIVGAGKGSEGAQVLFGTSWSY